MGALPDEATFIAAPNVPVNTNLRLVSITDFGLRGRGFNISIALKHSKSTKAKER
jgi:hypothetical protein